MSMNSVMAEGTVLLSGDVKRESREEVLVSAAKSGDHHAFVELCQHHSKKMLPTILRITKNRQDTEDVLQDSFLKAFVHLESFEGRSSFSSWLTRIAINSALMLLRKKHFQDVPIDDAWDNAETHGAWEPWDHRGNPESIYARLQHEKLLRQAIRRLPSRIRQTVELRHTHDYSSKEIAQELGISLAAAKSRLTRARSAIQATIRTTTLGSASRR